MFTDNSSGMSILSHCQMGIVKAERARAGGVGFVSVWGFFWLVGFLFPCQWQYKVCCLLYCTAVPFAYSSYEILHYFMVGGSLRDQDSHNPTNSLQLSPRLQAAPDSYRSQLPCLPTSSPARCFCLQNVLRKPRCGAKKSIAHQVIANLDNQGTKTIHVGNRGSKKNLV